MTTENTNPTPVYTTSKDFDAEYKKYLPLANAIPADKVLTARSDMDTVCRNVKITVAALASDDIRKALKAQLVHPSFEDVDDLPMLALTTAFAARRVDRMVKADQSAKQQVQRGIHLYRLMNQQLRTLAAFGKVPEKDLATIRRGKGALALASALEDTTALLNKHAPALAASYYIGPELIDEAKALSQAIRDRINQAKAGAGRCEEAETRDRLWTLLVERYAYARKLAYLVWGEDYDRHAPALASAPRRARKAKDAVESRKTAGSKAVDDEPAATASAGKPVPPADTDGAEIIAVAA